MLIKTFSRYAFNTRLKSQYINDETVEQYPKMFFIGCVTGSSRDSANCVPAFADKHPNTISETFDDTSPNIESYFERKRRSNVVFDKDMARRLVTFIETIPEDAESVLIHCSAGISRSGAIGYYIANKFGLIEQYVKENPQISPNPWVLELMLEASNEINHTTYRASDIIKDAYSRTRVNSIW